MLPAGRLRFRAVIERLTVALDETSGAQTETWAAVFDRALPAQIVPLSGRELLAAQAVQSKVTTKIRVRFRPGITASMRARHRETIYNIEAVVPDDQSGRRWMWLQCTSGVNAG